MVLILCNSREKGWLPETLSGLPTVKRPDPYSMKRVDDTLDLLGEAFYLTKLDLAKGYYQILVKEEDIPKTAFSTPLGEI